MSEQTQNTAGNNGASSPQTDTLVFDVETIPIELDAAAHEAVEQMAERREVTVQEYCSLSPPLAAVCSISMLRFETSQKAVYYLEEPFDGATSRSIPDTTVRGFGDERSLLGEFFNRSRNTNRFVTFNGRGFDFPLLLNRALAHGISPPSSFLRAAFEYRYRPDAHIDLMEMFTLFGAGSRYPLSAYCIGQGVDSPKHYGSGGDVIKWVSAKDLDSLVRYSLADVEATSALYANWTSTIDYSFNRR